MIGAGTSPPGQGAPRLPPKPSRATRKARLPSKGSGRVKIVGPDRRKRVADSFLEADFIRVRSVCPDILDILEQPAPIAYRDALDVVRWHRFDAIIVYRDGTRLAAVVKPSDVAARKGTSHLVRLLARDLPANVADGVVLVTEQDVGRDALHDARLIIGALLHPQPGDDAALLAHMRGHREPTSVADLCRATGLGGTGFRAVARLIGEGSVVKVSLGRIAPDTLVELAPLRPAGVAA